MAPIFHTPHEIALAKMLLAQAEELEGEAAGLRRQLAPDAAVPVGNNSLDEVRIRVVFCESLAAVFRKLAAVLGE